MDQQKKSRRRFTVSQLFGLPDGGERYEIFDGEVQMVPPPSLEHQYTCRRLFSALDRHVEDNGLGELFFAPTALVLDEVNYVEPDLIFVSSSREVILTSRGVEGVPDLVVEVLSQSTQARDATVKRKLYEQFGIPHYWLVNPRKQQLEALVLEDGQYGAVAELGAGDEFEPRLFPGLVIELDRLFRDFSS